VAVAVVLEVWNELVELGLGRLEGPSWRDVDAPNDLVHSYETGDVATLRRLLPYVVGPVFLDALFALSQRRRRLEGRSAPAQSNWGYRNSNPSEHMPRGRSRTNYNIRSRRVLRHSMSHSTRLSVARSTCQYHCAARRPASLEQWFLSLSGGSS
jgi:hypothetical protein